MNALLYKIVERMLLERTSLSRNKNFAAFEDPRLKRAARIVRHIRSLREDLRRYGREGVVRLEDGGEGPPRQVLGVLEEEGVVEDWQGRRLMLVIEHLKSRRTAYLSEDELRLLRLDPEIDALLIEQVQESI